MNDDLESIMDRRLAPDVASHLRMDFVEELGRGAEPHQANLIEARLSRTLIYDNDPVVRHEAAFSLGKLYSQGCILGCVALESLCHVALNDTSIVVRHEALESLGCFPQLKAKEVLYSAIESSDLDVSATARISLARLTADTK